MKIAIGVDHGGFEYKDILIKHLEDNGHICIDYGTHSNKSCDYPIFAQKVSNAVASNSVDRGILICGTGIGMSIVANKHKGIRCALAHDYFSAKATRQHNDTNVLALGARVIGIGAMLEIVDVWIKTEFIGVHHTNRIKMINEIDNNR